MKISDRLFGSPLSGAVRAELERRQNTANPFNENNPSPLDPVNNSYGAKYNLSERTPFVRMWTNLKLFEPELLQEELYTVDVGNDADSESLAYSEAVQELERNYQHKGAKIKPIYEDGVLVRYAVYDPTVKDRVDYATQTYIVGDYNYQKQYGTVAPNQSRIDYASGEKGSNKQGQEAVNRLLPPELETNPLLKGQAGITSVSSETQELLGATKQTTVNFTVNNFYDFDRIYNRYFLKPGATIFVDFGWSDMEYPLYEPETLINSIDIRTFLYGTKEIPGYEDDDTKNSNETPAADTIPDEEGEVTKNRGSLEVIQGIVIDYNAKITQNGSVECSVTLLSTNSALLSSEIHSNQKSEISNILKHGVLYLGILPALQELDFTGTPEEQELARLELERKLITPNAQTTSEEVTAFNDELSRLAHIILTSEDLTPKGNAIRTGVFVNKLTGGDSYVSFGFFEDIIVNENFGFGENPKEIIDGKKLNVRMDSSNSFTEYHKTKVEAQQRLATDNKKATPVYLYPETWLDMESQNDQGSYNYQKKKYPLAHYSTELSLKEQDVKENRIPIREMFISTRVIEDAFDDSKNIREVIQYIVKEVNGYGNSEFNWSVVSEEPGSSLRIVDNNKINAYAEMEKSTLELDEEDPQYAAKARDKQNLYHKNIFKFDIMSPDSIVKEYNLEFKIPSDNIGNLYAINAMGGQNSMNPVSNLVDEAVAVAGMDDEALTIAYQPDMGAHRAEQIAVVDEDSEDYSFYQDLSDLVSTNTYNVQATRTQAKVSNKVTNRPTPGENPNKTAENMNYDAATRQITLNVASYEFLIEKNNKELIDANFRIANSMDSYNKKVVVKQEEVSIVKRPNLLPYTLSLTIYGISSIQPGDIFRVDYLPKIYQKNSILQTMKVIHNINSDGWSTTLETQFRPLPAVKKRIYKDSQQRKPFMSPTYLQLPEYQSKLVLKFANMIPGLSIGRDLYNSHFSIATSPYGNENHPNKFDYNAYMNKDATMVFQTLPYFMTNIEPKTSELAKNLDYIKEVWKFKVTKDIEQSSLKDLFGDDTHGFYNPLFSISNKITGYVKVKKRISKTVVEKGDWYGYEKPVNTITEEEYGKLTFENLHEKRDDLLRGENLSVPFEKYELNGTIKYQEIYESSYESDNPDDAAKEYNKTDEITTDYRDSKLESGKLFKYQNTGKGITIQAGGKGFGDALFILSQDTYDAIGLDGADFDNFNQAKYVFTPKPVKLQKNKYYYFVVHADGDVMTILTEKSIKSGILEIFNQPLLHKAGKNTMTYLMGDLTSLYVNVNDNGKKTLNFRDLVQGAK